MTLQLTSGSIAQTNADSCDLTADAAGKITLSDGSEMTFEDVEKIHW